MVPSSGLIVLASRLSRVDLPAPFWPLMVTISEVWALKLTRLRANLVPYHLQTALALMVVVGCSELNFKGIIVGPKRMGSLQSDDLQRASR